MVLRRGPALGLLRPFPGEGSRVGNCGRSGNNGETSQMLSNMVARNRYPEYTQPPAIREGPMSNSKLIGPPVPLPHIIFCKWSRQPPRFERITA